MGAVGEVLSSPKSVEAKVAVIVCFSTDIVSPEEVVERVSSIDGQAYVYCLFESAVQKLPVEGARFMEVNIFRPLYERKKDVKVFLYSLAGWHFKKGETVDDMPASTPIGDALSRISGTFFEVVYASSFFQFCKHTSKNEALYQFLKEKLKKKEWLFELSADQWKKRFTIRDLFVSTSFFDCIEDLDVARAYSVMQYVEGYFWIRQAVERGLSEGLAKINVVFVLPNDEYKFYRDFPEDIEPMLQVDFGDSLAGVEVSIQINCFRYGDSLTSRPYLGRDTVEPEQIPEFFTLYKV